MTTSARFVSAAALLLALSACAPITTDGGPTVAPATSTEASSPLDSPSLSQAGTPTSELTDSGAPSATASAATSMPTDAASATAASGSASTSANASTSASTSTSASASTRPSSTTTGKSGPSIPAGPCTRSIDTGVVDGDLTVPAWATCQLGNVTVRGDVLVLDGGSLETKGTTVEGDVEADQYANLTVNGGTVAGDVLVRGGNRATLSGVTIRGSVRTSDNAGPQEFRDNTIAGKLTCKRNASAPTGSGNTVQGDKIGQCRTL